MAEPAAKKAKTEDGTEDGTAEMATDGEAKDLEPVKELEEDDKTDNRPKIKELVVFRTDDTTLNVMPTIFGNMLTPITDGGLQFLVAGARASVGVSAGRVVFEAKIVEAMNPAEDSAARGRAPQRCQFRIGLTTAGSSLFLGESAEGVCFDTEGFFMHDKKRAPAAEKFGPDDVVAVLVNLNAASPNANTVSLFKNGVRASLPQALPESLVGKPLYPTLSFKNVTVHYNFGPVLMAPLPFTCRMLSAAAAKDVTVSTATPKEGKNEVLFPVAMPDEGGFDWLDLFLEEHPNYNEISDRAIMSWLEKSGMGRPKKLFTSHDKPESGFGIAMIDDGSIRRAIQAVAQIQPRNYVVMELAGNLLKEERKANTAKWPASFKRTAAVMIGEPPAPFKKRTQEIALRAKQDAADNEFRAKKAQEKAKKLQEKKQKQLEKEKKKAEKQKKKMLEAAKKKVEAVKKAAEEEKLKKEAAAKGEEAKAADEAKESEEKKEEAEEEPKDEDEKDSEEEPEVEEDDEMEVQEDPPKVELTAEEKKLWFRKDFVPDVTPYVLNTSFTKFTCPDKEDGFDEIRFEWYKGEKIKDYIKSWVQERKLTSRVEDIQPSDWFMNKYKEWQKAVQLWHQKQNAYKQMLAQKAADKAAKEARKQAKAAKQAAKEKAKAEKAAAKEKAAAEKAAAGEAVTEVVELEEEEEKEKEEESEPEVIEDDGKVDFDKLDVFGVEDFLNVGGSEPLFSQFGFEDWTMLALRYELHILVHSFRKDVKDPDRIGIHVDHLAFYYQKYFKKALNCKFFGVETVKELLEYVRDTLIVSRKNQVVQTQLPDDMESLGIFVMLTEEHRRERVRRVDLGDDTAKLKLSQPGAPQPAVAGVVRPVGAVPVRPVLAAGAATSTAAAAAATATAAVRPAAPAAWYAQQRPPYGAPRPYGQQAWPGQPAAWGKGW